MIFVLMICDHLTIRRRLQRSPKSTVDIMDTTIGRGFVFFHFVLVRLDLFVLEATLIQFMDSPFLVG